MPEGDDVRYSLKDYQEDAVAEVLDRLKWARADWCERRSPVAFSLTATTGSGKTVMAAAVIEALFNGSTDHDFDPDSNAVVLWFTDDPSLNEQTRYRLLDAADRIPLNRMSVIENTFNAEKLEAGKLYFLNAQKLGSNSLLVRGAPGDLQASKQSTLPMPDARAFTMWDTLANTISDELLTLYVILDEAHRGMKPPSKRERAEKATIVQRLVNGAHGTPPVPIVWGISATVERFDRAMADSEGRTTYPPVTVSPTRVQESGLLKDDIRLDIPEEAGKFDTVLLRRATRKAREATRLWQDYAMRDGAHAVVPLLVVQVPNKPSNTLLALASDTIRECWPELETDAMAHVFGDHAPIKIAEVTVPHVAPETVQDRAHIRVLFAKDAISTGWDCPRAEVLVSFRPAKDETHITQLLGRMVRTPLARRVPGNDLLNSVECVLPLFDRATVTKVASSLLGERERDQDGTGGGNGRRVLLAPVYMNSNSTIPDEVWHTFEKLPSQTLPRKTVRPVRRLSNLAQALSRDGLLANARREAHGHLCARLDGLMAQHQRSIAEASNGILQVEGESLVASVVGGQIKGREIFVEAADERSVEADFQLARRVMTPDLARAYADHITEPDEDDDGLFDAHVKVAALAQVEQVTDELDREADHLCRAWFDEYRVAIKNLTDERQAVYDVIKGMSPLVQTTQLKRPRVRAEETKNEHGEQLETRIGHLMSDAEGNFPIASLNQWEIEVLDKEMSRPDFLAWYRNPARPSADALAVAYIDEQGNWRRLCPDFLFFHGETQNINVSIVDPHGTHFSDALPKLCGLADLAEQHADSFHRIESVARMANGTLRVLDLASEQVRVSIANGRDPQALYASDVASDY